jgi:hypothetical protein
MYGSIKYTSMSNTQALGRGTIAIVPYKKVERYARPGEGQTSVGTKSYIECAKLGLLFPRLPAGEGDYCGRTKSLMNNE